MIDRSAILTKLAATVSPTRMNHCLGVEEIALQLADRFEVAIDFVTPAALLHDLCREYRPDLLLKLAGKFDIVIDDVQAAEPLLLHGLVASQIARRELGIVDPDILEAIAYHITGGPGLAPLAHLIFIADFIEPGRVYEVSRRLREEAFSLPPRELLLRVYNQTIAFVIANGYLIHPLSIAGRNELILKG